MRRVKVYCCYRRNDENGDYEPVAVGTMKEIAEFVGIKVESITSAMCRIRSGYSTNPKYVFEDTGEFDFYE